MASPAAGPRLPGVPFRQQRQLLRQHLLAQQQQNRRGTQVLSSPGRLLDNALELPAQLGSARGSRLIPGVTLQPPGWVWWR